MSTVRRFINYVYNFITVGLIRKCGRQKAEHNIVMEFLFLSGTCMFFADNFGSNLSRYVADVGGRRSNQTNDKTKSFYYPIN